MLTSGSSRPSTRRERPIAMPISAPASAAMPKATARRSSVSAAWWGRIPDAVSRTKVAATCSTVGKRRGGNAPACATSSHSAPTTRNGAAAPSRREPISLVDLDAGLLDELGVFLELSRDHRLEVGDRHGQRVGAQLADLGADLRRFHQAGDL